MTGRGQPTYVGTVEPHEGVYFFPRARYRIIDVRHEIAERPLRLSELRESAVFARLC